ncbi:TetR/AcrR family transcriptional regulator [uncultured Jatrophihabitans sp.]|uniref:TetR/AcrR family transcriptional regulator n=1 Tax=uncultured Jatrophihabitans sp. TaxID=1610747 RepID=UPI0035CB765D
MAQSGIEARRQAAIREGSATYLARRAEIVRVAADIFREHGVESATLQDVAKVLGTDRASLYYYVASKEELIQEIVRDAIASSLKAAETIKRSRASTRDKIQALIESMVNAYVDNYPHMSIYTEDLGRIARQDSEWAVDVTARARTFDAVVRSVLAKGSRDGTLRADIPVDLAALALFGMINWMHRWYSPNHNQDVNALAETFTKIFLDGCGAQPAATRVNGRRRTSTT